MNFLFSEIMTAKSLFKLVDVGHVERKPSFMNLSAHRRSGRALEIGQLKGAGIYGLFLHDKLFYVGIYSGDTSNTLEGTVLTRWKLHLTYQTLRSPKVCFAPSNLEKILEENSISPFDQIASACGEQDVTISDLRASKHPLLETSGASCTYNKARFASNNWDVFRPGNESMMESAISFVFARLDPQSLVGAPPMDLQHRNWIKKNWLERIESAVICALDPICNRETKPGTERWASLDDFREAMAEAISVPLPVYVPGEKGLSDVCASSRGDLATLTTAEVSADDLDSRSLGEAAFRSKVPGAAEVWIDELDQICPIGLDVSYVNIPELRIYHEPGHRLLTKVSPTKSGKLTVFTRASLTVAKALGFNDAVESKEDWRRLTLDIAEHQPSALIALAGAALASKH